ncbi:regulator of G-protein signaling 14a isoform X3 [Triplophysa dalaica]|uniref:regulator of G-protein signaling 14a isoform X3 n=1 Tax=Triplophysa dalaica TaxID=1582913 RepID=UPI0024DF8063|nr:regulator of G-protein signaling 14a isoform X3 [Triplophysa dalaica]
MSKKMKSLVVPQGHMTQAVSDGELNVHQQSSTGGSSSSLCESSSRSGGPHGPEGPASRVVSWAVCFERLLEDHVGVRYFTEFLKSEVSAENILFYQACERFKNIPPTKLNELKKEARSIYDTFLSESSLHAVNIDDTAQTEESSLETPTPDMFDKAQQQIFKLMKMDSYTRFVRSQLYQNCMLSCVEGRPLPNIGTPEPKSKASKRSSTPPSNRKSVELKALSSDSKSNRKKRLEKRGSWGADGSYQRVTVARNESQISVKSNSSLELVSGFGRTENVRCSVSITDPETLSSTADKYCCVYLPDGTASLAPAKPGVTLRDVLSSLCEKRGFPLTDVFIYLNGKDKSGSDEPLSMSTNVYHLAGKTVCLDRVKVGLETPDGSPTPRVNARTRKLQEMDGLVEMLSRAQCSRVEDQRGLLTKEQLELPKFLQLSGGNGTLTSCDTSQDELCVL